MRMASSIPTFLSKIQIEKERDMLIVMTPGSGTDEKNQVLSRIHTLGYKPHLRHDTTRDIIGATGDEKGKLILQSIESMRGVESVRPILMPYKLASREMLPEKSFIPIGDSVTIGGENIIVMAGPCPVKSESQIIECAIALKAAGVHVLCGCAFEPRSSPCHFQALDEKGLKLLAKTRKVTGLPVATEVVTPEGVGLAADYADILQISARNSQNFALLKKVGQISKPILLKRGVAMTIEELLMSAEYILSEGNQHVILCEQGIRTFETATRNTLDLSAIPVLKELTHLPIIVDPSQGTGNYRYVPSMAYAAIMAGADGLMIDVQPDPSHEFSDTPQSLTPFKFALTMKKLGDVAAIANHQL
jgi:3-deoxy-7-phosphoheptulonate synthase